METKDIKIDSSVIIGRNAKRFSEKFEDYEHRIDGDQLLKNNLTLSLYDYYDKIDKVIFLYAVEKERVRIFEEHLEGCTYKEEPTKCSTNMFYLHCQFFIEQEIKELNPSFNYTILRPNLNSDLLKQNLVDLKIYPEAAKVFQQALDKLNETRYERNVLDDLRLSLEYVLRGLLKNDKSLENQKPSLGEYIKTRGGSKEFNNMFMTLVDYYGKYQNEYVKHNDEVKQSEIEFIVNLTSAFIRCLVNI